MEATPRFELGVKALQASALPLGHVADEKGRMKMLHPARLMQWSGQRGSNPRPQPWQGCALPTEPCPLCEELLYVIARVDASINIECVRSVECAGIYG